MRSTFRFGAGGGWVVLAAAIFGCAGACDVVLAQATKPPVKLVPGFRLTPGAQSGPVTDGQPVPATPLEASPEAAGSVATATSDSPETDREQRRIQLLLAARYDRTPQGVLKAWRASVSSEPPSEPTGAKVVTFSATVVDVEGTTIRLRGDKDVPFSSGQALEGVDETGQVLGQLMIQSIEDAVVTAMAQPDSAAASTEVVEAAADPQSPAESPGVESPWKVGQSITLQPGGTAEAAMERELNREVESFSRDFTLGNWDRVSAYLAGLKNPEEADKVYARLLDELVLAMPEVDPKRAAQQRSQMQQRGETPPTSFLTPDDILAITEAAPKSISVVDPETPASGEAVDSEAAGADPSSGAGAGADAAAVQSGVPAAAGGMQQVRVPVTRMITSGGVSRAVTSYVIRMVPVNGAGGTVAEAGSAVPKPADAGARHLAKIAQLIQNAKSSGYDFTRFLERIKQGTTHFGGDDHGKRLTAAALLMSSGFPEEVEFFLPSLDDEAYQDDLESLRQWAALASNKYQREQVALWRDRLWTVNQRLLSCAEASDADRQSALTQLLALSSSVDESVGRKWLEASFTTAPDRGLAIVANLGSQSAELARKAAQTDSDQRLKLLKMQNEAVQRWLEVVDSITPAMQQTLTLLAQNWITESKISVEHSTQSSRSGNMSIDMYGNYYWTNSGSTAVRNGRQPIPIPIAEMLTLVPEDAWQQEVDPALLIEIQKVRASLHMRINEEEKAFPFIEAMAAEKPQDARELVHEFLRIWTQNHDPNSSRRQQNPYIYMYGFDQKAQAIPLTRSKQERNLEELAGWVQRIRRMPIEDVDEKLLANAFTTCHSSAEVYRLDRLKDVFGELGELEPQTIAELAQRMRLNLSNQWRSVKNQEAKQTRRRLPEIREEVSRGYRTAVTLVREALAETPDDWKLNLGLACILFDENEFQQSIQTSSDFSDRRNAAFAQFAVASDKYRDIVQTLDQQEQETDVFDYWFYASLGAVDLGKIEADSVPSPQQLPEIREALAALPGPLAESHLGRFANNLFTRMSPIKPELKFGYLKAGFEIVGDHPRAWEARKLYQYYQDLVTEIQLSVDLDGSDQVGTEPFGLYVNLKHTKEIERESGGFTKYVQNQNNMSYAYNYGRPTEDYRDKFRDALDLALQEHFEVQSVTFESVDTMKSRSREDGWRLTPYAYVMVKPRGPEVDRVPSLQMDLDFLDTSGYVVIPIESAPLVIDANGTAEPRPIEDLNITQVLDERQATDGKLILEVSASGKGLIPDLEEIVDLKQENFEIVDVDDQGSLPTTFDPESQEIQILSDRSWSVEYKLAEAAQDATRFTFAPSIRDDAVVSFKRYEDADLVSAEPVVTLDRALVGGTPAYWYWGPALIALAAIGIVGIFLTRRPPVKTVATGYAVPEDVNPFTVLSLLNEIRHQNGIDAAQATELDGTIHRVEAYYFGQRTGEPPEDLEKVARDWVGRASRH